MSERENPISTRSKRLIVTALMQLMKDTPFSKITIRDIVDKAGLTRQTFYHNFESKEDVLVYKLDSLFAGFFAYLAENKIADCESIIWFYFRYWQSNIDFLNLLINNNLTYVIKNRYPEYFKMIRVLFLDDKDISDLEKQYVISFIGGAVINLLETWVSTGQVLTPREMASLVMRILEGQFYGLTIPTEEKEKQMEAAAILEGFLKDKKEETE